MATTSGLRDYVVAARKRLRKGRNTLKEIHDSGASGRQIVSGMTDLADSILLSLFDRIVADHFAESSVQNEVALVLHGGSGRREMAPYSDLDLMLLYRRAADSKIPEFARILAQDLVDVGLQLGHSVRTPREAWSMGLKDPQIFSSLTEARFIGGNRELYEHFFTRLQRIALRNSTALIRSINEVREFERKQFGETVYLLRPHIKKSRGAMRDVHLVRWLGFAKYGETDIDQLCRQDALTTQDASRMHAAYEFLLRIRNEMHFHHGRMSDELGKPEQLRIAEQFGYQGHEGVLPVEEFMRNYFDHTTFIRHISDQFIASLTVRRSLSSVLAPLMTRQVDDTFLISPYYVGVQPSKLDRVATDFASILRLLQLSNTHGKEIDQGTWETIRRAMIENSALPLTSEAAKQFMAMFADVEHIGRTVRKLHEMRVLERMIPEVAHARNLVQFNDYHQYTVDEHSLRAVEMATSFQRDKGRLGKIYRSLREKDCLHLALLIHDLGKGYSEDHSEVGRRMAESIGHRFRLDEETIEDLKYLVHNHLMMSHVAFRRDISDEALVAEFAANVGSVKVLKLLYLLTCADIAAVGPDVLNPWKRDLLTELYLNAKNVLTGHHGMDGADQDLDSIIHNVGENTVDPEIRRWLIQQARNLPRNYCRQFPADSIAEQLLALRDTIGDQVQCWVLPSDDGMIHICLGKREKRRAGIFYKITGMLASNGFRIVAADIKHLSNSLVWYWFRVDDADYDETPSPRVDKLREDCIGLATGRLPEKISFRKLWRSDPRVSDPRQTIRIQLDNQTVQSATVIDVFAFRKFGLLYTIAKELFTLGLDVRFARISTYGDRVVNVFYVTDSQGNKIRDRQRLDEIRDKLLRATHRYLELAEEEHPRADQG